MHSTLLGDEREAGSVTRSMRGENAIFKSARVAFRLRRTRIARLYADIFLPRVRDHARGRQRRPLNSDEESFQAVVERLTDIIIVLNGDGTMRYQNSAAEHMLGYKPEETLGVCGFDFVHAEDLAKAQVQFAQLLRRPRRIQTMVLRVRHRTNEWRVLEASAVNLLDDQRVEGVVIVCRDVTERLRAEADLRQAYNDAKRQVRAQSGKLQRAEKYVQAEVRQRRRAEVALQACEEKLHVLNRCKEKLETQLPRLADSTSALRGTVSVLRLQLEAALAHPEHVNWNKLGPTLLEDTRRVNQLIDEFFANCDLLSS